MLQEDLKKAKNLMNNDYELKKENSPKRRALPLSNYVQDVYNSERTLVESSVGEKSIAEIKPAL